MIEVNSGPNQSTRLSRYDAGLGGVAATWPLVARAPSRRPVARCYLKKIYLESTSYHVPAARCPVEMVGADHFIFGTDAPPMFPLKKEGVELIRRLNLPRDEEEKVYAGNARRLVKLVARLPGGGAP